MLAHVNSSNSAAPASKAPATTWGQCANRSISQAGATNDQPTMLTIRDWGGGLGGFAKLQG